MEQNEKQSYTLSTNLLKLENACIITVKGKTQSKKGVFIPIEENDLYISLDEALKPKGAFLGINAWVLKSKGQYGDTHLLKVNLSKERRESMTKEEIDALPIIGNMKPIEKTSDVSNVSSTEVQIIDNDDLPF
jgi:hypothetical protein